MNTKRPSVETLFTEALEIPSAPERAVYVERACAGDLDLRRAVESLLEAHEQLGSFLDRPLVRAPSDADPGPPDDRTQSLSTSAAPATFADPNPPTEQDPPLPFLTPSQNPAALGRLGHYEVLGIVGRGGMGVVLRAADDKLHRVVAIKVMAPELAASATARKRFIREAQAAAAVCHEHVVTIHAVDEEHSPPYLVMQYVEGISLQDKLDRTGPLGLREILRIGMQTAAGLAAAHKQGLVHRDIKPANILLENGIERVKITDFGLARAVDDASLTQSGVIAGTPMYMSPEQAEGHPVDQRSDLFSLGSVLYALCVGHAPFRGGTSRAVLRRVCEDAPRPIRELNPDIPDWLCALIARLQAKDPNDRFASAAEVAELLGRHLAELQQPSDVRRVSSMPETPMIRGKGAPRRRHWAVAAAMVLMLLAGLGLSDAAGVTHVAGTVIRWFHPEGTLIVEVDDPGVSVAIDGEELVITGAGTREIRLRPGQHQVQARKDGRVVRQELVTVTSKGRQMVKVSREKEVATAPKVSAIPGARPFVVLDDKGVEVRRFDTLIEAVRASSEGDTIEIRGNGPFVTKQVNVDHSLTIRAASGYRPVIRLSPKASDTRADLISSNSRLVLEGLELWGTRLHAAKPGAWSVVVMGGSALHIANCRVVCNGSSRLIQVPPMCRLTNCELQGVGEDVVFLGEDQARWTIENCLLAVADVDLRLRPKRQDVQVQLARSTLVAPYGLSIAGEPSAWVSLSGREGHALAIDASQCVLVVIRELLGLGQQIRDPGAQPLSREELEKLVQRSVHWRGERTVYAAPGGFLGFLQHGVKSSIANSGELKTLEDWRRFWGSAESDCVEEVVKFQGGDLAARAGTAPETLTPEDFRLRPDSAGYRAGPDGKDLGADIDLVGPGPAYERWKTTPAYQEWLKDVERAQERTAQAARQ